MSELIDKKIILEAAIFAAGEPLSVERLSLLFDEAQRPTAQELKALLEALAHSYQDRGVELKQTASGYRFQARECVAPALQRLWEKKAPRYSRAFLETLALVAYRQPITRGEIEEIRGVAVNSNIMRQLLDREWIKIVGHKDVPGKPALFSTTKQFLDYFNLCKLSDLPSLQEMMDLEQVEDKLGEQLNLEVDSEREEAVDNVHPLAQDPATEDETKNESQEDVDAIVEAALAMADALEEAIA